MLLGVFHVSFGPCARSERVGIVRAAFILKGQISSPVVAHRAEV